MQHFFKFFSLLLFNISLLSYIFSTELLHFEKTFPKFLIESSKSILENFLDKFCFSNAKGEREPKFNFLKFVLD